MFPKNIRFCTLLFVLVVFFNVVIFIFSSLVFKANVNFTYTHENNSARVVSTTRILIFNNTRSYGPDSDIITYTSRDQAKEASDIAQNLVNFHYITTNGKGRLGNKLFQFAAMIGIAEHMGYKAIIPKNHMICRYFDIPQAQDLKLVNIKTYGEHNAGMYDQNIEELSRTSNWTLTGYYQSWRYFDNAKDVVKRSLEFKKNVLMAAQKILQNVRHENETLVGIHIRRGDMNTKYELKRGYNVAPLEYIIKAMKYFENKYKNVIFVVVSDDKGWCIKNLKGNNIRVPTGNSLDIDLALLAKCNHTIVTSGSFGWWGAWLSGGETVYFSDYPKSGSWLDSIYNKMDYYPRHWIPML